MEILLPFPAATAKAFVGTAAAIGEARDWARCVLGEWCPRVEDVLLVISELTTNAVIHSASGAPGGRFAVQIELDATSVGVTCIDMGPALTAAPRPLGEGGHGLKIVKKLADTYEVQIQDTSRIVCCWLDWASSPTHDERTSRGESA
ncbi:ATP-binding protein [Nonomuraea typhae]|uniref:ATP-binding protein n=1 Tax=Nonomuraea typhae TaxID=2603600 RepID=UPI0012FBBCFD|nr:ATP-binding protein [Nonomuraea typhae]